MTDSNSAIEHFRQLFRVAEAFAEQDIAVYEHDYAMLMFGSFSVEVGTRNQRWRFSWDGFKRGSFLYTKRTILRMGKGSSPF